MNRKIKKKDTSESVDKFQVDLYRKMSPAQKFLLIFEAYQTGKMLAMAGLRQLHPKAEGIGHFQCI